MSDSSGSGARGRPRSAAEASRGRSGGQPRQVQGARRVAFDVLQAVSEQDAYANLLLPGEIRKAGLSAADAALATEVTYGTLRLRGTYDAIIAVAAGRPIGQMDPLVLNAVRLGTHQLLSTRVAAHAAVNESVNLASAAGRGAAGFVNAVLRRIAGGSAQQWVEQAQSAARSDDERLAISSAHPVWVIRALRRALAAEGRADELDSLLDADNSAPTVTFVALPGLATPREPRRPFAPTAFGFSGGDPLVLVEESGGALRVQDEGSQLAALALAAAKPIKPQERWLDLCAGPGGKTALLGAIAHQHQALLEANEVSPTRAGLVRQAVAAVPSKIPVHEEDGRVFAAERPLAFDRILVDAPCTGLGALRRRPEARWRKTPGDVPELVSLQEELLEAAVSALAPGGIVAYVTCSPHRAETDGVVREILRRHPEMGALDTGAIVQSVAREPMDLAERDLGTQLWPHRHGTDAMFIALLHRPEVGADASTHRAVRAVGVVGTGDNGGRAPASAALAAD